MRSQHRVLHAPAHAGQAEHHKEGGSGYTCSSKAYKILLQIDDEQGHIQLTPVKKLAPLTTRSSTLRCVSADEHYTAEQHSKTGRTKPRSIFQEAIYPGILARTSTRYLKPLRSCSGNQVKMFLKSHLGIECHSQYNKVVTDTFNTIPPIVNAGDCGCIVRDLETIIVLFFLAFNFISQRSHHSLTLTRSRLRDSVTVTLTPGDGTIVIKVESPKRLF